MPYKKTNKNTVLMRIQTIVKVMHILTKASLAGLSEGRVGSSNCTGKFYRPVQILSPYEIAIQLHIISFKRHTSQTPVFI